MENREGVSSSVGEFSTYPEPDHQPSYAWLGQPPSSGPGEVGINNRPDAGFADYGAARRHGDASLQPSTGGHDWAMDTDISSDNDEDRDESELDDDFYTLQSDVASFQRDLRSRHEVQAPRMGTTAIKNSADNSQPKRSRKLGPHKPVEPSPELRLLLSYASEAFVAGDYDRAEDLCYQIMLQNDEIYEAHALLSGVYLERGETRRGIIASMSAAHLRPRDSALWKNCANTILDHAGDKRTEFLKDAIYCYSHLISIFADDLESRYERVLLVRELGLVNRAARELETLHSILPRDRNVVRLLAEVYTDLQELKKAEDVYQAFIEAGMGADGDEMLDEHFGWSDVNIYINLFGLQGKYREGIFQLKRLARWLLGRDEETFWDDFHEDDREWDAEDFPRRLQVSQHIPGRFNQDSYGQGLPMELRVKCGIYRLRESTEHFTEALEHLHWLEPETEGHEEKLYTYPDLFREAADALQETDHHYEALKFYEPLQQLDDYTDLQYYFRLANSYRACGNTSQAEQCYKTVVENDETNLDARAQLAQLYDQLGRLEEAFAYASEVLLLTRQAEEAQKNTKRRKDAGGAPVTSTFLPLNQAAPHKRRQKNPNSLTASERQEQDKAQAEVTYVQYARLQDLRERMQYQDDAATMDWMETAAALIMDFRSVKTFFPFDKYIRFLGWSPEAKKRAMKASKHDDLTAMEAMAGRLHAALEQDGTLEDPRLFRTPKDYRGISFDGWLDVFLQYALCLARRGESTEAYEILTAAYDANIFYHSHERCFLIHICWAACAMHANDDKTICATVRWFMKEYQFTTDVYRLFAALNRLCDSGLTWYGSGASQKFVLRQIKAMDYSLVSDEHRRKFFGEKGSYTAKDSQGNLFINDEMDVGLLMLYAQMLCMGGSYFNAFNYFFRASELDPTNPMIKLFLAISYMHVALKRQSDNRHYLIMQGFTFIFEYYNLRKASSNLIEQQEAEYNVGRCLHLLGLMHLALPYYHRVLDLSKQIEGSDAPAPIEDFALDAAYNLRTHYVMVGNMDMAKAITEDLLVL
ncbi:MAG: transcription factor TFIIIC subunit tfc4 [Caeruleum heppii]|nr:MAG: transcription factor TFIIIC subunit tfc4 [Caeruleum heppii]